jgi:hypothetical protein
MPYADRSCDAAVACRRRARQKHYYAHREAEIARSRKWSAANPDRIRKKSVIRRSQKLPIAQVLFNNAKMRAKSRDLPFDLSVSDIVVPEFCPVLGVKLEVAVGHAKANSPSIDRIDPSKGYTRDNICVISYKANTIKNDATLEQLREVVRYVESFL